MSDAITREEMFLAAMAGEDVTPPTPVTRKEKFYQKIMDCMDDMGGASAEDIAAAVAAYLEENPAGVDLSVTGATVGQIPQIAAVDDDGVPTAWEPVDLPDGGGLEYIGVFDVEAGVSKASFSLGGNYTRVVIIRIGDATATISSGTYTVSVNWATQNSQKVGYGINATSAYSSQTWDITVMRAPGVGTFAYTIQYSGSKSTVYGSGIQKAPDGDVGDNTGRVYPIYSVEFEADTDGATFNAKTYYMWGVKA